MNKIFTKDNYKGSINSAYSLQDFLWIKHDFADDKTVKFFRKSKYRLVFKKDNFVVKKYYNVKTLDWVKNLFKKSKAKKEWEVLSKLQNRGINVPCPVLYAEKRKFGVLFETILIIKYIANSEDLLSYKDKIIKENIYKRIEFIHSLAEFVKQIHNAGLYHKDLHGSNLLIDSDGKKILLDFHKACWKRKIKEKHILSDLAYLNASIASYFNKQDALRFLQKYFDNNIGIRDKINTINKFTAKYCDCKPQDQGHSLSKARGVSLLANTSKFYNKINSKTETKLIKESSKTKVFCLKQNKMLLLIKQDKTGKFRKRYQLEKEWLNSFKIKSLGLSTPQPIYISNDKKNFHIAFRFIENSLSSDAFFYKNKLTGIDRIRFIKELAFFVRKIHDNGIYHKDLKCANILIRQINKKYQMFLIDNARVYFKKKLKDKEIIFNLTQINASFTSGICKKDRMRFIMYYSGDNKILSKLIYENVYKIKKITKLRWEKINKS